MAGYLGKISAVVSVNTGDFAAKLNRAGGDVEKFAGTVQRSLGKISSSSSQQFAGIYTEVQKLERALQAASTKLNFSGLKGFDGKSLHEAAEQMRQIHSVASQLSSPLSKAVAAVEAMSMEMRTSLHAAMVLAQTDVEKVQTAAQATGDVTAEAFASAEAQVAKFSRSVDYARETLAAASKMGGGGGFQFQMPAAFAEMQRGAKLFSSAGSLPASKSTAQFAQLLDQQQRAAAQVASMAALNKATPSEDSAERLAAAERVLRRINDAIQQVVDGYAAEVAASKEAADAVVLAEKQKADAIRQAAVEQERAATALRSLEQARMQVVTGEVQSVSQLASAYASLINRLENLSDAQRKAQGAAIKTSAEEIEKIVAGRDEAGVPQGRAALERMDTFISAGEGLDRADIEARLAAIKEAAEEERKVRAIVDAEEKAFAERQAAEAKKIHDEEMAAVAETKAARDAADKSRAQAAAKLLKLQQDFTLSTTGQVQSVLQLNSAYESLIARAEKLTTSQRASMAGGGFAISALKVQEAIASGDDSQVQGASAAMTSMEAVIEGYEILNEQAKAATKSTEALNEALGRIADSIGTPAAQIDQLKESVDRMNAAIDKMKSGSQKTNAEGFAAQIRQDVEAAQKMPSGSPAERAAKDAAMAAAAGRAKGLTTAVDAVNSKKTAADLFGPAVGSRASQIDQLKSKIVGIHSEMEKLPVPLQVSLRPQLEKIRMLFENLGPKSTRKDIEDATRQAKLFGDEVQRTLQAQKIGGTFGQFLDDTSFKKYEAELSAVQAKMAEVGATAGGPTAQAINKYRAAFEKATLAGSLGTDAVRENMRDLLTEIEKAIVAEGKLTAAQAKGIFGGIKREGDVSRGGADKAGLALNQAAFAIDDFMSASGGVEMKIRAISNNLTQMAYILGSTKGLWIALGAVIASQAAIAVYKFVNGGKSAEDTTKALNDALDKQKNLVAELAGAYRDLAKSMALSSDAQKGADNASVLGTLAKGNYDNRMARLTGVNSAVVSERASQAAIKRAMESSGLTTNAGTLIFRNERLKQAQAGERVAEAAARAVTPGRLEDLEAMRADRAGKVATMKANFGARAFEALGQDPRWNSQFNQLSKELEALEEKIRATEGTIDDFANNLAMAAVGAAQNAKARIEAASSLLASAIEAGVPGAREFQNQMDAMSMSLSAALNDLAAASEQTGERRGLETAAGMNRVNAVFGNTADLIAKTLNYRIAAAFSKSGASEMLGQVGSGPRMAGQRAALVGAATRKEIADAQLGVRSQQAATAATEANRIAADGRKRIADAQQSLQDAQRMRWTEGDEKEKARVLEMVAAAEAEVEAQKKAANAADAAAQANVAAAEAARNKAQADVMAADNVSKLAAAAAQAAVEMEEAVARTRGIGESAVSSATQVADMRQKEFTERPTAANKQARDAAEKAAIATRERVSNAQAQLDQRMAQAQLDPVVAKATNDLARVRDEMRQLQAEAAQNGTAVDASVMKGLQVREAEAERRRSERLFDITAPERDRLGAIAQEQEQKRQVAEMELRGREFRAAERGRVRQGREDAMTVRERQRLEAERGAENMAAAAGAFGTQAERKAFVQQFYDNRKKEILQSGPMGQAADERFNAMAPGARRIGIEASDVATAEGSRELNRLLRGDDANKDANFAEMQRQTELLSDIRDGIQANTGIGVIDR